MGRLVITITHGAIFTFDLSREEGDQLLDELKQVLEPEETFEPKLLKFGEARRLGTKTPD